MKYPISCKATRRCPNRSPVIVWGRAARQFTVSGKRFQKNPAPGIQLATCGLPPLWHCIDRACCVYPLPVYNMITLEEKIAKTERLLRRLEEDQPYLHVRLSAQIGRAHV